MIEQTSSYPADDCLICQYGELSVACPKCAAGIGLPCRTTTTGFISRPHSKRVALAAKAHSGPALAISEGRKGDWMQVASEGWKLVPMNPTPEMNAAGNLMDSRLKYANATDVWSAMIAESPVCDTGRLGGDFVLMPQEPTEAMLDAYWAQTGESREMRLRVHARMRRYWSVMLAAYATPTSETDQLGGVGV